MYALVYQILGIAFGLIVLVAVTSVLSTVMNELSRGPMFALESNPDLSFAQGTQCRETQRNRTHEPGSCKKRSGGVAPALAFSRWAIAQLEVYRIPNIRWRRLGARSANRWGSYEINRSYVEAVRLLAHSCPGRVRRHVRSWRKPTPHSRRIRWSTD